MGAKSIALVLYGDNNSTKNAFTEEKYKALADSLLESGFNVESVLYNDSKADFLEKDLLRFNAVLVWVNPVEQGFDRSRLDTLLINIAKNGVFISTHPEIILKIGTKKVLYSTRSMDWGGDIEIYTEYNDFENSFLTSLTNSNIRVLKQYRGNGGNGVFKVYYDDANKNNICIVHASNANEKHILSKDEFHKEFSKYFENNGLLINQQWSKGITNGMVRCYLTGNKVSGFGYQESVALCPYSNDDDSKIRPTSGRFYFTEYCGMFQDLRQIMESKWIPQLQEIHSISDELMPLLWDIDLFINDVNTMETEKKYTICEINVSCVSPFPPSCINHIVNELKKGRICIN
jgi:hypothetical protein